MGKLPLYINNQEKEKKISDRKIIYQMLRGVFLNVTPHGCTFSRAPPKGNFGDMVPVGLHPRGLKDLQRPDQRKTGDSD